MTTSSGVIDSTYCLTNLSSILACNVQIKSFHDEDVKKECLKVDGVGDLRALEVAPDGAVWIGGTEGKIAKSINNGRHWNVYSPSNANDLDFRAICALDSKVICCMSAGDSKEGLSRVYRSIDGGEKWSLVLCPQESGFFFNAMKFWDEKNGIILADPIDGRFAFFTTSDGGKNWNRLIPKTMPFAFNNEAAFAASNSCLAVYGSEHVWFCTGRGDFARVFYSSDNGKNWDVSTTSMSVKSSSSGLFSMAFKNEDVGVAVGGDYKSKPPFDLSLTNAFLTSNGGKTWDPLKLESSSKSLTGHYLSSVAWDKDGKIYVIDGSKEEYNSLIISDRKGWAVGPNQQFAMFET